MSLSAQNEGRCDLHCCMQILRDVPLFTGLSSDFFRVMAYLCERQSYGADQVILAAGETAETAVIVVRGDVRIEREGRRVATLAKGSCVGGMALLGKFRWLYSLRAETELECLLLYQRKFLPQFIARPDALAVLAGNVAEAVVARERRQLEYPLDELSYGSSMI